MQLEELITENAQNGNNLDDKNYASDTLWHKCTHGGIERGERKKETEMTESVTKQRDAGKRETPAKCEHRCPCWRLLNALSECHGV
jgi:hypothetical protein